MPSYKCNSCKHESYKFGLCPECKDGLMIKKAGYDKPNAKGWQPHQKGVNDCQWRNRRHD